jgi:hypothetical protein
MMGNKNTKCCDLVCSENQNNVEEFEEIVNYFNGSNLNKNDGTGRYTSFDYCFNWFQTHKGNVANSCKIEQSCLHLMCYLASWGMLRGSSMLLQKSAKFYEPLIKAISGAHEDETLNISQEIWNIDVDSYCVDFPKNRSEATQKGYEIVIDTYNKIKKCLYGTGNETRHIVSVTKIMMGVFGCVPALDRYFCETFHYLYPKAGFSSDATSKTTQNLASDIKCCKTKMIYTGLTEKHLCAIYDFYCKNKNPIDSFTIKTKTFDSTTTSINYTKAKIIDMYGFSRSFYYECKVLEAILKDCTKFGDFATKYRCEPKNKRSAFFDKNFLKEYEGCIKTIQDKFYSIGIPRKETKSHHPIKALIRKYIENCCQCAIEEDAD